MNATPRTPREQPDEATQNVPVIGGAESGPDAAEYQTAGDQSVAFVSEGQSPDVTDEPQPLHRRVSGANDVRAIASEITGVNRIDIPRLLAE